MKGMERGMRKLLKGAAMPAIACLILSLAPQFATADNMVDVTYDWVVQVQTQELKRQFEYQGSTLNPIQKLEVQWYPPKKEDEKTPYEHLWYHDGRAYGMEKQHKLDLPEGEAIAIEIKHKNQDATASEKKAAANAIVRLALDAYINKNPVPTIKVPIDSFGAVSSHLQSMGFFDPSSNGSDFEEGYKSVMTLNLYSVPEGKKAVLVR
ncbi:MAG: hypothetical protein IAF58_10380 [Leptolyngbya sp.]|nr:hypothetical protein [Candidatus Melainabacteria bacterium]